MAGVVGRIGSFATTEAPKDPLLDTLQNIEQVGFQKRAEKRLTDDIKAKERKAQIDEDVAWDGKFDPTIVGNSKIDDPMLNMSFKAKNRVGQIRQELRSKALPYEKEVALRSEMNKIAQSFDVANQTPKIIMERAKEIAKNIDKYDQQEVSVIESIAKQLETGKYEVNYDDQGVGRVKIFKTDESGKPIGILKETTLADLANEFQPTLKSTYKEDLQKYAKDYEVSKTTTQDYSGREIIDQRVDRRPGSRDYNNAMEYAKVIISKPNERKIIARNNNLDPNDEQGMLKFITTDILNAIPDEYSNKADARLAFDRAKEAKKEKEDIATIEVVETPPVYAEKGVKPKKGYKTVSVMGGKPVQQIVTYETINGKKQPLKMDTAFLNSYTVVDNPNAPGGRSVVAEITYPDFKNAGLEAKEASDFQVKTANALNKEAVDLILSKATKPISYKTKVINITEKDASKYLPSLGFKDVSEMADKAKVYEEKKKVYGGVDANGKIIWK